MRRISSLIEQAFRVENVDSDFVQTIKSVSPARTFLEKAFYSVRNTKGRCRELIG